MKSERRHELEKNELADWLTGVLKQIKPYQNLIAGTLIFALVVLLVYTWSVRHSAARTAQGWTEFNEAFALGTSGANFEEIVEQYPNSDLGNWAAVLAGDAYLTSGSQALFVNKADAFRDLNRAADHYTNVLEKSRQSMIRQRATFGLARALESMAQNKKDVEAAAEQYEKVFTNWPNGAFAETAEQRFENLSRDSAAKVYERFADYEPKPALDDEPGVPGERPAFDPDALPDDAPAVMPSVNLDGPSSVDPESSAEPGETSATDAADAAPATEPETKDAAPADVEPPTDANPATPASETAPADEEAK